MEPIVEDKSGLTFDGEVKMEYPDDMPESQEQALINDPNGDGS